MNLYAKQKHTHGHRDQTVVVKEAGKEGSTGSLGLVDANYYN